MAPAAVRAGDGAHAAEWIEALCRVTKDSIAAPAGDLIKLRRFQRSLLGCLMARDPKTGRKLHRVA